MASFNRVKNNFTDLNLVESDDFEWGTGDRWIPNENQSVSESCSTSTWASDEDYEKEIGEKVGWMLEAVDSRLYEGIALSESCKNLELECQIWAQAHPHLRIRGESLGVSNGDDFTSDVFGTKSEVPYNADEIWAEYELIPSLELVGTKVNLNSPCEQLSEEIIETDGTYEELIAFDNQDGLWPESESGFGNENELERKIIKRLTHIIWSKIVDKLGQDLVRKWTSSNSYTKLVSLPPQQQPAKQRKQSANNSSKQLPDYSVDLQSLLTISSKTLLNRSIRPPSVRARTLTSSNSAVRSIQRSGNALLPFQSGCNRKLAPLDTASQLLNDNLKVKNDEQSSNLLKHFPALPPIEKVIPPSSPNLNNRVSSSFEPLTRAFSESKPSPSRLHSGSRLSVQFSKINLGSSQLSQLNTIMDFPRSANWVDRAKSGRNINSYLKTNSQLGDDFNRNRISSAFRQKRKSDPGALSDKTKPKFGI